MRYVKLKLFDCLLKYKFFLKKLKSELVETRLGAVRGWYAALVALYGGGVALGAALGGRWLRARGPTRSHRIPLLLADLLVLAGAFGYVAAASLGGGARRDAALAGLAIARVVGGAGAGLINVAVRAFVGRSTPRELVTPTMSWTGACVTIAMGGSVFFFFLTKKSYFIF